MLLCLGLALFNCTSVDAREGYREIRRGKEFYSALEKNAYVIMLFVSEDTKNREMMDNIRQLKREFARSAKNDFFRAGGLQFYVINVAKNEFASIADRYRLVDLPAFVLFEYGIALREGNKNLVQTNGYLDSRQINRFINYYFKNDFEDAIRRKAELQEEARQERERAEAFEESRPSAYFSYGIGFPGYYPGYWGYPYQPYGYWNGYGPSFGFGVTVPIR